MIEIKTYKERDPFTQNLFIYFLIEVPRVATIRSDSVLVSLLARAAHRNASSY